MKSILIATALAVLTAGAVAFYPALTTVATVRHVSDPPVNIVPVAAPKIEAVFVLDTTSSMSGMIEAAKEKIWSIASTMASAQPAPEIKIGLVAFRDRGDRYVTQVIDLSEDLDSMYATLMDFRAEGGGDGPESVNQALHDAVQKISWSQDPDSYQVIFLVGDAPPHMDYQDDVKYPVTLAAARMKGIVVNTIQCGDNPTTTQQWVQIAQLSQGRHFNVAQGGDAIAISTPFDTELATLSKALDDTRLYYGTEAEKVAQDRKVAAADKLHNEASVESRARRASFNASVAGTRNFLGRGELVSDIADGRVDLLEIDTDELPESMRPMSAPQQQALIAEVKSKRDSLQRQITDLAKERESYIAEKIEEVGGAEESLDYKIFSAVRDQAGKKGLVYEDAPSY
jgi:Mg-chelatase subunit ChlD